MRLNRLLIIVVLLPIFLFINENRSWAAATPSLETLTPNEYEEKEFKENTDYLNEKALYEQKDAIPEIQQKITFEKPTSDPLEKLKGKLFDGAVNNTVSTQAKQLKLFTGEKQGDLKLADKSKTVSNPQIKVTVVLVVLLAIGLIVMIVLLIPKMIQGNRELK